MGYKSYRAKKKSLRTPAHKKQGFFLFVNINTSVVKWDNVIWSQEAHFEVFNRKNCTFVHRRRLEYDQPFNFVPKVQGSSGCVSVWGFIADGARGPQVMHSGKLNGGACAKVIEETFPLFIENTFDSSNQNWMFMHGNAPSRRSKYTLKCFESKSIKIIKWFAVSPNRNPIENIWDLIDKKLKKTKPTNVKELEQMIQTIWYGVTCLQCKVLVGSMPRRIGRCIRSTGGTFNKY